MRQPPDRPAGFVKTGSTGPANLSAADRAQLIRKGNECFNTGKIDLAERIFITCKYGDGLARVGDVHFKKREYQKAMQLYVLAKDSGRVERLAKRMALVVRQWLLEEEAKDQKKE